MVVALIFFGVQSSKVVKADTADVIGTLFGESKEQSYFKSELRKWGLEKKDLVALKSKEIQSLFNGNILIGDYHSFYAQTKYEGYTLLQGGAVETYYKDGKFKGVVLGQKQKVLMTERAIWSVKQNKLCYKGRGCVKVYKHKGNPNVYFLKSHGFSDGRGTPLGSILVKFFKITSIAEVEKQKREQIEKAEKERIAKEKKVEEERRRKAEEERIAKEKKAEEERIAYKKKQKKLKLIPQKSELESAQHFLNKLELFLTYHPDEFDVIKISEFLILTKPISENIFEEKQKNDLALFKDYTSTSSKFNEYFDTINQKELDMQYNEIENIYDELESSKSNLERKLASNAKLAIAANHIKDIEILLENPESLNQLKEYNESVKTYIASLDKAEEERIAKEKQEQSIRDAEVAEAYDNILELKEKLKEDLTSDLAPSIIQQVKLLEKALEKENSMEPSLFLKDLDSANKKAYQFIYKNWLEAEIKKEEEERIAKEKKAEEERIAKEKKAEEERIAKEKEEEEERRREADNKFHYKSAWGSEKLYDCKSLAKEAKKVKLSNMLGGQFTVITLTNVTETINNRSELSCVGDARLSNGSESKLIMRAFHVDEGTLIEVRQDQQDMLNKFLKNLGQ